LTISALALYVVLTETRIIYFCLKRTLGCAGPNPTTLIYNASFVNFYNATGSLARFEDKNILL
jgi:hypothetical protein